MKTTANKNKTPTALFHLSLLLFTSLALSAHADIPVSAYVQNGLIAQWDGIDNAGTGTHDPNATTWKELKGDLATTATALTFRNGKSAYFNGTTTSGTMISGSFPAAYEAIKAGAFTVDLRASFAVYTQYAGVFHFGVSSNSRYFSLTGDDGGPVGAFQYKRNSWDVNNCPSQCKPALNTVVNVTAIANGNHNDIYLNGELQSSHDAGTYEVDSAAFQFGKYAQNTQRQKMDLYAVRLYDRVLTADEIAYNEAVDYCRFGPHPELARVNESTHKIEVCVKVSTDFPGATVTVNGGTPATSFEEWFEFGTDITLTYTPGTAGRFRQWEGLADTSLDATQTTVQFKALPMEVKTGHHTITWNNHENNTTYYWDDTAKWTCTDGETRLPDDYDIVVIPDRTSHPYNGNTIVATNRLPRMKSLYVGTRRTLSVRGWENKIEADEVIIKGESGDNRASIITAPGGFTDTSMSNRIWIVGEKLILSNAWSQISSGGYAGKNGPGWAGGAGAAGDAGTYASKGVPAAGTIYGSITEPDQPGTGSWHDKYPQNGGGAIRLQVTNIVINGSIAANGSGSSYGWGGAAGSGGSVYISCGTISGTGSVSANGGGKTDTNSVGVGGGGRVAVHYDPVKQASVDCGVAFSARGGQNVGGGTRCDMLAGPGTVYLTDDRFLNRPGCMLAGNVYYGPELTHPNSIIGENLAFTNTYLEITAGGSVNVTGNLSFKGSSTRINGIKVCDNVPVNIGGDLTLDGARLWIPSGSEVNIGGNLVMKDGAAALSSAEIYFKAAATNGHETAGYASYLNVAGDWLIGARALAKIACNGSCGSIVGLKANNVTIDALGELSAAAAGWDSTSAPGHTSGSVGGSYGGRGSNTEGTSWAAAGKVYGDMRRPLHAGSPSISSSHHQLGGGVIYLQTSRNLEINGTVNANGAGNDGWTGAGSGGSVYLKCAKLIGNGGKVTAKGGSCGVSYGYGSGGGGRIAIWCHAISTNGENIVTDASGGTGLAAKTGPLKDAEPGTVYWHQIRGTMLILR